MAKKKSKGKGFGLLLLAFLFILFLLALFISVNDSPLVFAPRASEEGVYILGRVYLDRNGNGEYDEGEYIVSSTEGCPGTENVQVVKSTKVGVTNVGFAEPKYCNKGGPYFALKTDKYGAQKLGVIPPEGYVATTKPKTIILKKGDKWDGGWFGIKLK